jgi:hypothetical protein
MCGMPKGEEEKVYKVTSLLRAVPAYMHPGVVIL